MQLQKHDSQVSRSRTHLKTYKLLLLVFFNFGRLFNELFSLVSIRQVANFWNYLKNYMSSPNSGVVNERFENYFWHILKIAENVLAWIWFNNNKKKILLSEILGLIWYWYWYWFGIGIGITVIIFIHFIRTKIWRSTRQ